MNNLQVLIKQGTKFMKRNSPTILTGLAVAGLVSTVVMAVRTTPKAMSLIFEKGEQNIANDKPEELSNLEIVQTVWKLYIPSALMGATTVACIIGANSIHLRRNAALAGVLSLSEAALKEYQAKVVETIGENKARKIKDDIAKDHVMSSPIIESDIVRTGNGNTLCFDTYTGRYFWSDIEYLRRALNELNRELLHETEICLNDVYFAIGLDSVALGRDIGWLLEDGLVEFDFSSQLTRDERPCLVVDYKTSPSTINM